MRKENVNIDNLFYLDEFIDTKNRAKQEVGITQQKGLTGDKENFQRICKEVMVYFEADWDREQGKGAEASDKLLMTLNRAIIGYEKEVNYYRSKIQDYLKNNNILNAWHPTWYEDLVSAIFHENWGFAGIQAWKAIPDSSSAKIIGDRVYFLINGKMQLQEQRFSKERLKQLIRALMMRTPEVRISDGTAEVYMLDNTRIKIFMDTLAKLPVVIFRKYIINDYRFEEQAKRNTIPFAMIPMLDAMTQIGYNVAFLGPVRSGKSTFLETWQNYEDKTLEGIQVETDPEIQQHLLNPDAPIIEIVADGERLRPLMKDLVRSDADYMIMAEARDGVAAKIGLKVTAKGTRRVKITFHTSDPVDFAYDFAEEIVSEFGGDLFTTIVKVAKGFHYLFELCQLKDKSQKRLKGVYELRYDPKTFNISVHQIVKYDFLRDDWTFKFDVGKDKEEIAYQEDYEAFKIFRNELEKLSKQKPMLEDNVFIPSYMKLRLNN